LRTHSEAEFLDWAKGYDLGLDPQYPNSAVLTFTAGSRDARFWSVPSAPERRPHFLESLLELLGDWSSCPVWRHMGSWPDLANVDPLRVNDRVEYQILKALGLPLGTADVVEFSRAEFDVLLTLLFSTTIFGWSVGEDLYVVPNHGRYLLQTDHHDVVHVEFRDENDIERWVTRMAECGFPLPDELPDETFKQPSWMPQNDR
jgi:hypothetical protein